MKKYTDEQQIFELIYPIGSIYLSVNTTSPEVLFGVGIWEQIQDTFFLTSGQNYVSGSNGGQENHTHNYGLQYGGYYRHVSLEKNTNAGILDYNENNTYTVASEISLSNMVAPANATTTTEIKEEVSMTHYRSIGNTSYENNLPPYLVINAWKRIE